MCCGGNKARTLTVARSNKIKTIATTQKPVMPPAEPKVPGAPRRGVRCIRS